METGSCFFGFGFDFALAGALDLLLHVQGNSPQNMQGSTLLALAISVPFSKYLVLAY